MTVLAFDPTRDKSYQHTGLGADIAAFLAWCKNRRLSERTRDQYERDLAKGALMFPHKTRDTLTKEDALHIAAAFRDLERDSRTAAWRSFYTFLEEVYDETNRPFLAVRRGKKPKGKVYDIFTDSEVETLIGGKDGALMAILFDSGARKGDCRHLQLKHLREHGTDEDGLPRYALAYLDGKGGKDRLVPATRRIVRMVTELALMDGLEFNDYLWYSVQAGPTHRHVRRRKPIGEASFHTWWVARLEDAGVRYRNPHMARHTFATNWLRSGGRLTTLSMILGHSSIKTTFDEYGHLDTRDVLADLAVIEGRA